MGRGTGTTARLRMVASTNATDVEPSEPGPRRAEGHYPAERLEEVMEAVRACTLASGETLLKPRYRAAALGRARRPFEGQCYVVTEALYHLMGGRDAGYCGVTVQHEGGPHWWLRGPDGAIHDGTSEQFVSPVPYERGRGCGFQGRPGQPSARALVLIAAARARLD